MSIKVYISASFKNKTTTLLRKNEILPATRVPEVIVSTLMTIPRDGRALRNITPSNKLAIGTHLLIALYIGMFIPLRANKADKSIRNHKKILKLTNNSVNSEEK